jgi:indole-3-glycerol phosphate synthase
MKPSILQEIFAARRQSVEAAAKVTSLDALQTQVASLPPARNFEQALRSTPFAVIAEVKKGSPSKGIFRQDFDPVRLAQAYAAGGASAISVVTEPDFFWGSLQWLRAVREAVPCPLLRKDFTFSDYQVWEARAHGADAILLILAMLTDDQVTRLLTSAEEAGVQVLVEVHDSDEAHRACQLGVAIVGVNNRNLSSFEVSLNVSRILFEALPTNAVKVSESGIHTFKDCSSLSGLGYHAFLVGEALVRSSEPTAELQALRGQTHES